MFVCVCVCIDVCGYRGTVCSEHASIVRVHAHNQSVTSGAVFSGQCLQMFKSETRGKIRQKCKKKRKIFYLFLA